MKKTLIYLFSLFIIIGSLSAQNNDPETQAIKKQIAKSNSDIQNPKKSVKSQTWAKRAKIYMEAYSLNAKFLSQGLASSSIPLLGISETTPSPYYGKPDNITKEDEFEVWNYSKIKIYVINGVIDHWKDLAPIDTQALDIAYEALNKAIELDESGKFVSKNSTVKQIAALRELILNKAIEYYNANNQKEALNNIEKGIVLLKYPREAADTLVPNGAYYYYAGIFAFGAEEYTKSKEYFQKSLDEKYEIGTSYQYLVEAMYKLEDTLAAVKLLEEGAQIYPQETKIIYSLIDYYTPRGDYDKAFKYIDKAIGMTPENAILYIVKGASYQKIYENIQKKYFNNLNIADSLDKEAFKYRNNPAKQKEILVAQDDVMKNKIPAFEKDLVFYKQKATESFEQGVQIDANSDYYYTIAYFYYKIAILNINEASHLRKLKDYIAKLEKEAGESLTLAQQNAEKSLELKTSDVYTMELLSKIYYRQRNYDKSTEMKNRIKEEKNKANN